jgi:hypothetical protein
MPIDLTKIPPEDRQDFERRLQTYGVDTSIVQQQLSVATSAQVNLAYGPNRESALAPFVIQTNDISRVKQMVGVDNNVFRNVSPRITLPGSVVIGNKINTIRSSSRPAFQAASGKVMDDAQQAAFDTISDAEIAALDGESVNNIRLAARAFVRGNSELVSSFKPVLEKVLGMITIPVWSFVTVRVARGSVLEFGPGVNALVAYEVIIEDGGTIRSRGHLTVNCTKLRKPGGGINPAIGPLTTTLGTFRPIFSE